jgi:hypothetical protein
MLLMMRKRHPKRIGYAVGMDRLIELQLEGSIE